MEEDAYREAKKKHAGGEHLRRGRREPAGRGGRPGQAVQARLGHNKRTSAWTSGTASASGRIGIGVGSGFGYAKGNGLEAVNASPETTAPPGAGCGEGSGFHDLSALLRPGGAWAGFCHLAPEFGFMLTPNVASPSKAASSTSRSTRSIRASRRTGRSRGSLKLIRVHEAEPAALLRHRARRRRRGLPLRRQAGSGITDPNDPLYTVRDFKDTVKAGPVIAGLGGGLYFEATRRASIVVEVARPGGLPDLRRRRRRKLCATVQFLQRDRSRDAGPVRPQGGGRGAEVSRRRAAASIARALVGGDRACGAARRASGRRGCAAGGRSRLPEDRADGVEIGGRRRGRALELLGREVERRSPAARRSAPADRPQLRPTPKSASTTSPGARSSRFDGLRSPCTMPAAWTWPSAPSRLRAVARSSAVGRPPGCSRRRSPQRPARDPLHRDGAGGLVHVVDRDDARVADGGGDARVGEEPAQRIRTPAARELRVQHLQRDVQAQAPRRAPGRRSRSRRAPARAAGGSAASRRPPATPASARRRSRRRSGVGRSSARCVRAWGSSMSSARIFSQRSAAARTAPSASSSSASRRTASRPDRVVVAGRLERREQRAGARRARPATMSTAAKRSRLRCRRGGASRWPRSATAAAAKSPARWARSASSSRRSGLAAVAGASLDLQAARGRGRRPPRSR